jgi:hypothetical protein
VYWCSTVVAAALVFSNLPASAAKKKIFRLSTSCGSWVQLRSVPNQSNVQRSQMEGWITGYMSGVNINATPELLDGVSDPNGLFVYVDNYCKSNPLDDLDKATDSLVDELYKRQLK